MSDYRVVLSKRSAKFLRKIDRKLRDKLINVIDSIAHDPYGQSNIKSLVGYKDTYRKRAGNIRIIYVIINDQVTVFVDDIHYRGDVYKHYKG